MRERKQVAIIDVSAYSSHIDRKHTLKLIPLFLAAAIIAATAFAQTASASQIPSATDYYESPSIFAGDELRLRFRFDRPASDPSSQALDMIGINWGSVSNYLTSVTTSLYFGGNLLGAHTHYGGGALALFKSPNSAFQSVGALQSTVVDAGFLAKILGGAEAELVVTPSFSSPSGFVAFSGWGIASHTGLGFGAMTYVYPSADLLPELSAEVAEPPEAAVYFAMVFCMLLTRRRRSPRNMI